MRDRQVRLEDFRFQRGDVFRAQFERRLWNRVLPQLGFLGNERAQVARDRPHVAVRQLEPGPGKRVRELVRMLVEAPRNFFVSRIEAQGEIGDEDPLRAIEDALRTFGADEIVISTRPADQASRLENSILAGTRERFALPVTDVPIETE